MTFRTVADRAKEEIRDWLRDIFNSVVNSLLYPKPLRPVTWRLAGMKVGRKVHIGANCFLGSLTGLSVGGGSFVNRECTFDLNEKIVIGRNVMLGHNVMILTSTHEIGDMARRGGAMRAAPVTIADGAWVGARSLILPGVEIGAGAVVAAGSVVIGECQQNALYGGVPARLIRDLAP